MSRKSARATYTYTQTHWPLESNNLILERISLDLFKPLKELFFSFYYYYFFVIKSVFFKFYFIFKLYVSVLVLPNIKMNPPQVYMCSPSWTLLPPPSPYHSSGSSQCTSPKHPVSYIEPGLATRFIHDILHVSMPFSQIFPPFPSSAHQRKLLARWKDSLQNGRR